MMITFQQTTAIRGVMPGMARRQIVIDDILKDFEAVDFFHGIPALCTAAENTSSEKVNR